MGEKEKKEALTKESIKESLCLLGLGSVIRFLLVIFVM